MPYPNEAVSPIKAVTIQSAIEDFDPVLARLDALGTRATNCADRIIGPRPSAVDNNDKNPSSSHLVWAIQERRTRLVHIVDHLEAEMQRIENGLA